ncbi:MAG: sialidase family protein [Planctomycetota bacterium]|nr:sialidase family protein [Planctomycetota bacterium]
MKTTSQYLLLSLAALLLAHCPAETAFGAEPGLTTAAGHRAEGELKPHLGSARLETGKVFSGERFPNVVVALDGTVVASWGSRSLRVRRSEDGGKTWSKEITIAGSGLQAGGLTVDETTGDIIAFSEKEHPPALLEVFRSKDNGKNWGKIQATVKPDSQGNVPSMHMNEHGITLRRGKHKGRLLRPSRWYAGKNERARWPRHYTNAVYSDDGGKTWQASAPFPAKGTGEATLAELSDGRIYYNSRRHWAPEGESPLRRWSAWSDDGGATWTGLTFVKVLPDGPQNSNYGCMGGLVRLPVAGRDILLYTNCDSPSGRDHGTVWASFDGGKKWPIKRQVEAGRFAYSSITAGRPGTLTEGTAYLHFESNGGSTMARFNLAWVLAGKSTGDGVVPAWVK